MSWIVIIFDPSEDGVARKKGLLVPSFKVPRNESFKMQLNEQVYTLSILLNGKSRNMQIEVLMYDKGGEFIFLEPKQMRKLLTAS